jgi:transposase InsO family protein
MDLGRFLVEAVIVSGASPTELARSHPISRSWLFRLLARYKAGGYAALEPRSRRPKSCPSRTAPEIEQAIVDLRRELVATGLDAGPQTIAYHLRQRFGTTPSRPTIWRILKSKGLITPQPHKRPRSSWIRFEADLPNEMWQADSTHWQLADGSDVEILNLIDDHSRFSLASVAFVSVKAVDVLETFYAAAESYGYPAKFLSDNAAVFSGKSRRGRVVLESELDRLGIESKHSSPYHPQTCGKVERFHQTLKRYLQRQAPAENLAHLQLQLDGFRLYYNQQRPHRSVDGRTPFQAFQARLKAGPSLPTPSIQYRVRRDKLDGGGRVTVRYLGRLRHLYVSYKYKRRAVTLLVAGPHLRVIADDGSILRELTLDSSRNYQPVARAAGLRSRETESTMS